MKKKIIILTITLLLIMSPTILANEYTYEDFVEIVNNKTGIDFETILANSTYETQFKNHYNSATGFVTFYDKPWESIEASNVYVMIKTTGTNIQVRWYNSVATNTSTDIWSLRSTSSTYVYTINIENETISYQNTGSFAREIFKYEFGAERNGWLERYGI